MSSLADPDDSKTWAALANGDQLAFESVYRAHVPSLYRYIRKNIFSKEECEEIIQEIFLSLWSQRTNLELRTSLRAYLFGIARHKIIRYFRTSALKRKYVDHFLLFEAVYDQAEGPEANLAAIQAALDKVIKELPARCQEALRLRLSEDLSNQEIAERMNISVRTVEAYMFRAFNHMRASYRQALGDASLLLLISMLFGRK